jgi:hypothetical protein
MLLRNCVILSRRKTLTFSCSTLSCPKIGLKHLLVKKKLSEWLMSSTFLTMFDHDVEFFRTNKVQQADFCHVDFYFRTNKFRTYICFSFYLTSAMHSM